MRHVFRGYYYSMKAQNNQQTKLLQPLKQMIKYLPQKQQNYHRILLDPSNHSNQQFSDLTQWIEKICEYQKLKYHYRFSIEALITTLKFSTHKKALPWNLWALNTLGACYLNKQHKIMPEQSSTSNQGSLKLPSSIDESIIGQNLAEFMVLTICESYQQQLKKEMNKNKVSRYKLRLLLFLMQNLHKVKTANGIKSIARLISSDISAKSMVQKLRYGRICRICEQIILNRFKDSNFHKQADILLAIQVTKLFSSASYSPSLETQQILAKIIMQNKKFHKDQIKSFFIIFKLFPTSIRATSTGQIRFYKKQLWEWFQKRLTKQQKLVKSLKMYTPSYLQLYTIYVIQIYFYEAYMKLKTREVDDCLQIIQKPSLPYVSDTVWQIYQSAGNQMKLRNSILFYLYHNFYKQLRTPKIKVPNNQFSLDESREKLYDASLDNEASLRLSDALKQLGIQAKRETKIGEKMADFVIQDNIIIECDGDAHINYYLGEQTPKTAYRNMIFMLSGYKLISVSFLDINRARSNQLYLVSLLKKKIEQAKQNDVYYVS